MKPHTQLSNTDPKETTLEQRILSGKVTALDGMAYAREHGKEVKTAEDLKHMIQAVYATAGVALPYIPGTRVFRAPNPAVPVNESAKDPARSLYVPGSRGDKIQV